MGFDFDPGAADNPAHFMGTIRSLEDRARERMMTRNEAVAEIRKQYTALVDQLESEGVCTDRECMCDTAEPVVKLGAAIAELERLS